MAPNPPVSIFPAKLLASGGLCESLSAYFPFGYEAVTKITGRRDNCGL
jgi:hypothetical protein